MNEVRHGLCRRDNDYNGVHYRRVVGFNRIKSGVNAVVEELYKEGSFLQGLWIGIVMGMTLAAAIVSYINMPS